MKPADSAQPFEPVNPAADSGGATQNGYLIGLDLGTSALKGVLLDVRGRLRHAAERKVHYRRPAPDQVVYEAENHWHTVCGLLRELSDAAPEPVQALAISGASGNTLLADDTGRALRPVISWLDQRTVGNQPLPGLDGLTAAAVRRVTGWPCLDRFPLAQLAWLRTHDPETYRAAAHVCMNTDWLIFRLTGHWIMDHSTATTFILQNQVARCWHTPYLERLGLRETQLSRLTGSGEAIGSLTAEAAAATGLSIDTQVATGAFDHPSAARAVGVLEAGQLLLSCGTSWVGFLPSNDRDALLDAELLCDPFLSEQGGPWAGMFSVPAIGPVIDWYLDHQIAPGLSGAARLQRFDTLAALAADGANGLRIDLHAPPAKVDAEPERIARAVMESAARAVNTHLERLRQRGFRFCQAVMVGGPGNSPIWPSIVADVTGLDIAVESVHAGAMGAAILAGIGSGCFANEHAARAIMESSAKSLNKSHSSEARRS